MKLSEKKVFYSEAAYPAGLILLAISTSLAERADFGLSTVVAPAYIFHLKISQFLPFFTFGTAEYCLQAVLLAILCMIMGKFRRSYLFSFVTAVIYGLILDACIGLASNIPADLFAVRIIMFALSLPVGAFAIALLFHTYISPEAYEVFVAEIAGKYGWQLGTVKTVYDITSCVISVLLSFAFFGFMHFNGIKAGTFINAALNGIMIGFFTKQLHRHFEFRDRFGLRKLFEK